MPNNELISNIVDEAAIDAEIKKLIGLLDTAAEKIKAFPKIQAEFKAAGITDYKQKTEELTAAEKELSKIREQAIAQQNRITAMQSEYARELAVAREQTNQLARENREAARETLGLTGAYKQLENQYKAAAQAAKDIGASQGIASQAYKDASAAANQLAEKLKTIDAGVGQFQRNVGNYAGSLKPAFDVLKNELTRTREKMDTLSKSGEANSAAFKQMQREEALLAQLTEGLNREFGSTRQELRALQEAAKQMGVNFGSTNETFLEFVAAVGEAKDKIGDLDAIIRQNASDTKTFDGLINAAQGLAGAWGAATGAVMLFGDGNEELQKKMMKLQAVMTILMGLQQFFNAAQKESAAMQTLLAIRTNVVAAAQKIWTFVLTGSTTAQRAAIAATEQQVVVEGEAAVATEAQTVAIGEQVVAQEALTAATTATSGAMVALRFALIATGIGALLLLIPSIVSAMSSFTKGTKDAADAQRDFSESLSQSYEHAKNDNSYITEAAERNIKAIETQISIAEKSGAKAEAVFALKKKLADAEKTLSDELIKKGYEKAYSENILLGTQLTGIDAIKKAYAAYVDQRQSLNSLLLKAEENTAAFKKNHDEDEIKKRNEHIETMKKQYAAASTAVEFYKSIIDKKEESENSYAELGAERIKKSLDDQKLYNKAAFDYQKASLEQTASLFKGISENEKNGFDARIGAIANFYQTQKQIIALEADYEISSEKLKGKALAAVRTQEQTKLFEIDREKYKAIEALQKDATDKYIAGLEKEEELRAQIDADVKKAHAQRIKDDAQALKDGFDAMAQVYKTDAVNRETALTQQYNKGLISKKKYEEQLKKLQETSARDALKASIDAAEAQMKLFSPGSKQYDELQGKIAEAKNKLAGLDAGDKKEKKEKLVEGLNKAQQYEAAGIDLISGLENAAHEKRMMQLQKQFEMIEHNRDMQVNAINTSTLNEQQKRSALMLQEKTAQQQKDILLKKQKQEDIAKAKFDKAAALLKIAGEIGIAVASGNIAAAIAGGIQEGLLAAKPIPQYAEGTTNHPGGPAIVGERRDKIPELITLPGGHSFIADKPTLLANLPAHAKVTPLKEDRINDLMHYSFIKNMAASLTMPVQDNSEVKKISSSLAHQNRLMEKLIAKKTTTTVVNKINTGWDSYINSEVRGI